MPAVSGDDQEFRGGMLLGSSRPDPIDVVPWDPEWPNRFSELRDRLKAALGELAVRIDHVGSTSIAGIPAKPVIDVQVSVPDVEDTDAYRTQIESLGFGLRYIEAGHRYFRPPPGFPRDYQVHVCQIGSDWERVHLLFRDYLRSHPQVAAEYGRMKLRLADRHRNARIQYNDEKGPFINAVVAAAEDWAREVGWRP
jgi:GrpB-like predicted nucleotidyltransferase (UPF0157 family)